jgi:hypothetical protein
LPLWETTAVAIVSPDGERRKDVHELEGARHAALRKKDRADAGDVASLEAHDPWVGLSNR